MNPLRNALRETLTMRETRPCEAWVDGIHFRLSACPETRSWSAYSPDGTYQFAGVADLAAIVPTIRELLALFTKPRLAA